MNYEVREDDALLVEEGNTQSLKERTMDFALRVLKLYQSLDKSGEAQVIGKQVLRSGTSVGANYREAHRARSKVEFIAKLGICISELEETSYWLELLGRASIISSKKLERLIDETNQLTAIFITISKKTKTNQK